MNITSIIKAKKKSKVLKVGREIREKNPNDFGPDFARSTFYYSIKYHYFCLYIHLHLNIIDYNRFFE